MTRQPVHCDTGNAGAGRRDRPTPESAGLQVTPRRLPRHGEAAATSHRVAGDFTGRVYRWTPGGIPGVAVCANIPHMATPALTADDYRQKICDAEEAIDEIITTGKTRKFGWREVTTESINVINAQIDRWQRTIERLESGSNAGTSGGPLVRNTVRFKRPA